MSGSTRGEWVALQGVALSPTLPLEPLEAQLVHVNRTLKRNKVFDPHRVQGQIVAALDGIEVLSSYSRCCDCCLERRVKLRHNGIRVEQVQYYHRAVGCQIVNSPVKSFLALEWLRPNEGEETAALRLLRRLPLLYGSRFFDILLLDALYAQTAVLDLVQDIGWDVVICLKQNQRDLYRSAVRLFGRRPADTSVTERRGGKSYQALLWDTEGLPFPARTPGWCGSFAPRKPLPKTTTAKANCKPSKLLTNGFGSRLSIRKRFPLPKCVV